MKNDYLSVVDAFLKTYQGDFSTAPITEDAAVTNFWRFISEEKNKERLKPYEGVSYHIQRYLQGGRVLRNPPEEDKVREMSDRDWPVVVAEYSSIYGGFLGANQVRSHRWHLATKCELTGGYTTTNCSIDQCLSHAMEDINLKGYLREFYQMVVHESSILKEVHETLNLSLTIGSSEQGYAQRTDITKLEFKVGSVDILFGMGPCREGYDKNTMLFTRVNSKSSWLELRTEDESILMSEFGFRSFRREDKVKKLFLGEDPNGLKVPPMVRMVYPDGKFFIDEDVFSNYYGFPDPREDKYNLHF